MANIQEEVTSQVWELVLRFLRTGTQFTYEIAHEGNALLKEGRNFAHEFLCALINKQKEAGMPTDVTAQMLHREQNGETIHNMMVAEEDILELTKRFEKNGILFNVIDNPNDDAKFLMYMSGDAQKAMDTITVWQAEKGLVSELNPDLFLDNFAKEGVGTLSGLDRADLELFRDYARKNKLIFSVSPSEEPDKYIVVYDPKDKTLVKKTMAETLWAFSGKDGAKIKEQTVVYLKNRQLLNHSLLDGEREFYIVNGKVPEHYIHLTANDFTYYKNSKEILNISRSADGFLDRGLRVIDGMSQPVLINREEYELLNADGEPDKEAIAIVVANKAAEIPDLNELKEAQQKQNDKLALIQSKMALDDENQSGFWIYDDSIDYSSGDSYEELEDIDDQLKADIKDAQIKASQYKFYEVDAVDERSIDFLIAEAEKRRTEPSQEQKKEEREL